VGAADDVGVDVGERAEVLNGNRFVDLMHRRVDQAELDRRA
jgi:hypothetical protein